MKRNFAKTYEKITENAKRKLVWRGIIGLQQDLEAILFEISKGPQEKESMCSRWDYALSDYDIAIELFKICKEQLKAVGCFNKGYDNAFQRALNRERIPEVELLNYRFKYAGEK